MKPRPRWWPTAASSCPRWWPPSSSCTPPTAGVVPEIAARRHLENILPVIQGALDQAGISLRDLDGLAVTQRPGLVGALIIGMAAAKALSYTLRKPLAGVHHLQAHIMAAFLTETAAGVPLRGPGGLRRPHQPLPGGRFPGDDPVGPQPGRRRGGGLRQGGQAHGPGLPRRGQDRGPGRRTATPRPTSFPGPGSMGSPSPFRLRGLKTAVWPPTEATSGNSYRCRGQP